MICAMGGRLGLAISSTVRNAKAVEILLSHGDVNGTGVDTAWSAGLVIGQLCQGL